MQIMKNSKEEIDEIIKSALTKEEASFYDELEEQSLLEMVLSTYQGKMKWPLIFSAFFIFLIFGLAVYCLVQFLNAETTRDMMTWGAGMFGGMMAVGFMKLFHWMEMNKNTILREVKRVEFQIGVLASKLSENK